MTAVKARDVERALRERSQNIKVLLFYGPDTGLVSERAREAAAGFVDDAGDPFKFVRLDGDDVASTPGRLAEEASSIGLFGGRKSVLVRSTSRSIVASVQACLDLPLDDTLIVLEAGDLAKNAPLRTVCEASSRALALPCFADDEKDIANLVAESLRQAGLGIEPEARTVLLQALGGDRLASRGEIAKLILYAQGATGPITIEDVEAAVSDVGATRMDEAIDEAFVGRPRELEATLRHLWQNGGAPGGLLIGAIRHSLQLLAGRDLMDQGANFDRVKQSWRGMHFRREASIRTQLTRWSTTGLTASVDRLQTTLLETRRLPALAHELTEAALLGIAGRARRGDRG